MHEEFRDGDPRGILAVCVAANSLHGQGDRIVSLRELGYRLMGISCLRASAIGWREAAMLFRNAYDNKKPLDARHDRAISLKYAREADGKADALCIAIGLPFEFVGSYQADARVFWQAYRNLHTEVNDQATAWRLVVSGGASTQVAGLPAHFGEDRELKFYANLAFETLHASYSSQLAAIRKRT